MSAATAIVRKELRDAARSRWLAGFAATFALTALALSLAQSRGGDATGQGFTRTTAGLVNLCLLLVPLLSLSLGAGSVASERERGTLASLLSQPISTTELLLAKYVGLVLAVWAAIALGFGIAGVALALLSPLAGMGEYFQFTLLSAGLAATMLSLGMLISVYSDGRMKALAMAIVLWFVLVLFYDFAAIGLALSISSSGETLLLAVLANPVEGARILAVIGLEPDLRVLGPLGSYLINEMGLATTALLLAGALAAWTALPLAIAARVFSRQDC
ncbi:MAG: hypothetical protein EPO16_12100 [Dehalococcoidia bacterium]|nr:MAG: hypothetical protein EPO16_12100 [Dehalococcoidia bacterium]